MATRNIKGSWYVDFRYQGSRYRKKSPLNTKGGAREYELSLLQRLIRGEPIVDAPAKAQRAPRFEEFAWQWFETYVKTNNKPSEQRAKEAHLRIHLVPALGSYALDAIGPRQIEEFKGAQLALGLCAKTVNNHLITLRRCLNCAVEWGLLGYTPKVKPLRTVQPAPRTLSDTECAQLLADTTEPQWHAMILLALRSGLRLGELTGLTWTDIDLEHGVLTVRHSLVRGILSSPKSGRIRYIPLDREIVRLLHAMPRHRASSFVFPRGNGEPVTGSMCRKALERSCRRAGVPPIGWHALRHTFATQLLQEREPIRNIQQLLGHSTLAMTERYTHALPDRLRASIDVLSARQRRATAAVGPHLGIDTDSTTNEGTGEGEGEFPLLAEQSKEHRCDGAPT